MKAYLFPGQGVQFTGMGKDLYEQSAEARKLFEEAAVLLGFDIAKVMFEGSEEELKQTKVTQPAIFLHSVLLYLTRTAQDADMVAGHSLGEFSALVANGALSFSDGLLLVAKRANAMQKACEARPSNMAAVLGLDDARVEEICASIKSDVVVPANYNCPGQLVISGSVEAVQRACELLKAAGAKRALILPVGGAFHSPLMEPARTELQAAIEQTRFLQPRCPVYQNVNAEPSIDIENIRTNLINQLTGPVRWTQSVQRMVQNGATQFVECGPGKVLQGLVKKIEPEVAVASV